MLNYANLNDVEFEYLCQDIMSKKLNTELRRFAPGRDGGIDLVDNVATNKIIVQVKHYTKTDVNGLIRSLEKEVAKVKELNPNKYYVCCSKELSPDKVKEIYSLFSQFMKTDKNILTLQEIDDFLCKDENVHILRKHYKLWISSTNILDDIFNNNIFIDSHVLLSDIEEQVKYFVQTTAYEEALKCMQKNCTLFITGAPGVGKTITSKMMVLNFASQGYRVRYTTDGADLGELKRSLSQNKEVKEVILLDDCFGQAYFNMKETQGNELLSLIKYVNISKNKLLILNSRVTIYQEAKIRTPQLVTSFERKEYKVNIIDMEKITKLEKAKILYNHLYFNNTTEEILNAIKENKQFRDIISHSNYNPRIIEYVSNPKRYIAIKPNEYIDFVMENLNHPSNVWEDEYERKLEKIDRILLSTLFSLTETTVDYNYVEIIFNKRVCDTTYIDLTKDNFKNSLIRLQESFVKIIESSKKRMITMVNPSVNDYLNSRILQNSPEYNDIIEKSVSIRQLKRLLSADDFLTKLKKVFKDESIIYYVFENEKIKNAYIAYYILSNDILNIKYKKYICYYLDEFDSIEIYEKNKVLEITMVRKLFSQSIYNFYNLSTYFNEWDNLNHILEKLDIFDLIETVNISCKLFKKWHHEIYEIIKQAIEYYCNNIEAADYDIDVDTSLYMTDDDFGDNTFSLEYDAERKIIDLVEDELSNALEKISEYFDVESIIDSLQINVHGVDDLISSYMSEVYDNDNHQKYNISEDYKEIDLIFER